ncbi:MAG: DotU family type IV/VI secretion system protein [Acidobacteriaceae bacterium]
MNSLALCFQEPLTAIVRVRSGRQQVQDSEVFRNQIRRALQSSMQEARGLGYPGDLVQSAVFAVVALLDESVLNLQSAAFSEWARRPLQEELFGGHMAGEVFFRNLGDLLGRQDSPETADCLEVYCLCLLLGYKGRYALGGSGELQASVRRAKEKIARSRGPAHMPQVQSGTEVKLGRGRDRWSRGLGWAAATACVLALLTFGALDFVLPSGASRIQNSTASTR